MTVVIEQILAIELAHTLGRHGLEFDPAAFVEKLPEFLGEITRRAQVPPQPAAPPAETIHPQPPMVTATPDHRGARRDAEDAIGDRDRQALLDALTVLAPDGEDVYSLADALMVASPADVVCRLDALQGLPDPARMADAELDAAMGAAIDAGDMARFDRLAAESDARDAARHAPTVTTARPTVTEGTDRGIGPVDDDQSLADSSGITVETLRRQRAMGALRDAGYRGRSLDALARAAYRDHVRAAYLAAEKACRGQVLTPEARSKGIDPASLFTGPAQRASRWASDELKEWWDAHGRVTFDEFVGRMLSGRVAVNRAGWLR